MNLGLFVLLVIGVFAGSFAYRLWRPRRLRRSGQTAPPRQSPPSQPPMADMTYECDEHYYDGCPNCGAVPRRKERA